MEETMSQDENRYGFLVSGLTNPITISYDGGVIVIPPRATRVPPGKSKTLDREKLGALPVGIKFIPVHT